MANGDSDYWKDRYEQEVLGKPKPKEYRAELTSLDNVVKNTLASIQKILTKEKQK